MSCIHNPDIQSLQFPFLIGIFLGLGIPSDDVFVNQKEKRSGEPCVSSPPSWGDICRIILGFGLYIKNAERCNDKITILVDRTTTMVAYQLATARSADLIAVVKNGVIAEKGKHET